MAQVTGTETPSTTGNLTSGFLATLRANLGVTGVNSNLFSSLLSQVSSVVPQAVAPVAPSVDNTPVDAPSSNATSTNSSDDPSKLQAMLQRINDDASALQQSQQTSGTNVPLKGDSGSGEETTAAQVNAANTASSGTQQDKSFTKTTQKADAAEATTTPSTDGTSAQKDTGLTAAQILLTTASAITPATDAAQNTATANTDTKVKAKDILADLVQTEQAASLLMNHMLQQAASVTKASGNGTVQTANATQSAAVAPTAGANGNIAGAKNPLLDSLLAGTPLAGTQNQNSDANAGQSDKNASTQDQMFQTVKAAATIDSTGATPDKTIASKDDAISNFLSLFNGVAGSVASSGTPVLNTATPVAKDSASVGLSVGGVAAVNANNTATPTGASGLVTDGTKPVGSYSFASQLSEARATQGGTVGLPSPVEQVAVQIHRQAKDGNDQMTIQMRPEELGRVDIKLQFGTDNKVQATVTADNPATLDMLSKDSTSLQRALQDAGLQADAGSMQFNLRGDGQQNQSSGQNANSNANTASPNNGMVNAKTDTDSTLGGTTENYYLMPNRVNMKV